MNMLHFQSFKAFDGTDRSQGFDELVGAEFDFGPDAGAIYGDIAPQPADLEHEALARALVASFRAHSHINNVMTHISGARWDHIEHALRIILDPAAVPAGLSRLATNILDLLCAEREVTRRILKPYFCSVLERLLPAGPTVCLQAHVQALHEAVQSHGDDKLESARIAAAAGSFR